MDRVKFLHSIRFPAIFVGFFCCVICCGCISQGEPAGISENPPVLSVSTSPIKEDVQPSGNIVSCTIMEISQDHLGKTTTLTFTENLGTVVPELKRGMVYGEESSRSWSNGERNLGTVNLESDVNEVFCNSRNPSADCIAPDRVYAFGGRYFRFICASQPVTNPSAGSGFPTHS